MLLSVGSTSNLFDNCDEGWRKNTNFSYWPIESFVMISFTRDLLPFIWDLTVTDTCAVIVSFRIGLRIQGICPFLVIDLELWGCLFFSSRFYFYFFTTTTLCMTVSGGLVTTTWRKKSGGGTCECRCYIQWRQKVLVVAARVNSDTIFDEDKEFLWWRHVWMPLLHSMKTRSFDGGGTCACHCYIQ